MPVVRLVAVARRALFDEPCAVLSDDRDLPTLMSVPLAPGDGPGLARVLSPWLGAPVGHREVTISLVAGFDGSLHAEVTPLGSDGGPTTVDAAPTVSVVDALTLSHRTRVPIRVAAGLLEVHRVEPCDIDRVVPIADRPPLMPTAEQHERLARAFAELADPDPER
ncbi:hypothetical protein [Actinomycetospora sp. TBRC 11914]|uniref:hypothetical protein n=1 Tax=Actinomycetospora sp. TBRC 11914 TaxID=2729387 RepID=UPI00145D59A1|nr:hypothetical protein [Actinomycetospora sp. TBRC 11914]NMO88607.1 hypothetical protein [Actinomycetospora sp. TBRC 11914]